jgi:hypothetical protein
MGEWVHGMNIYHQKVVHLEAGSCNQDNARAAYTHWGPKAYSIGWMDGWMESFQYTHIRVQYVHQQVFELWTKWFNLNHLGLAAAKPKGWATQLSSSSSPREKCLLEHFPEVRCLSWVVLGNGLSLPRPQLMQLTQLTVGVCLVCFENLKKFLQMFF